MTVRRYNPAYTPPATLALMGTIIAVTVVDIFTGGFLERLFWARGIDVQYGDYWRAVSCAWVHADLMHVAFNLYGIYVLGVIFERLHGWRPLLVIYAVTLLGGSVLALTFMDPMSPLVGASAAAYGLFGAVLGYFFAKTGSLRDLWQIPLARTLLIWLAFGVWMSLQPNVSLLGHAGGFVPGVILGVYFEHRYTRELDVYHRVAVGVLGVVLAVLAVFACVPVTRSSWHAVRAMQAYEQGDLARGDELLSEAGRRNRANTGSSLLYRHLELWREGHERNAKEFDYEALRLPLTHPGGVDAAYVPGRPPFFFLPWVLETEQLEYGDAAP
ncbi:MAG: rhomboid family intramembrane serine protease [Planctomycetes bacterium]|nr:rhomboid family intramembrane serine protease [Planctomycetota bacterium]